MEPISLNTPIKRKGQDDVTSVTLRKPNAGELRGVSLTDLLKMDVGAVIKVLPRVTSPALTGAECETMDTVDLLACASEVVGFFASADQRRQMEQMRP